ncbi:unnamed protein product [Phytophthora lilii]|uniref:RxLR effector protein n=1 Tax=Phytophthora lilii TaxID=2077276 RepID=A0A9W6U958_9STRA|nr:unnamed protein product [Phytophthora lilii]
MAVPTGTHLSMETSLAELQAFNIADSESNGQRLLRIHERATGNDNDDEERAYAIMNKIHTAVGSAKVAQKMKAAAAEEQQLSKAAELIKKKESFQSFLKAKITPEQYKKALRLKEDMSSLYKHSANFEQLKKNPVYLGCASTRSSGKMLRPRLPK